MVFIQKKICNSKNQFERKKDLIRMDIGTIESVCQPTTITNKHLLVVGGQFSKTFHYKIIPKYWNNSGDIGGQRNIGDIH